MSRRIRHPYGHGDQAGKPLTPISSRAGSQNRPIPITLRPLQEHLNRFSEGLSHSINFMCQNETGQRAAGVCSSMGCVTVCANTSHRILQTSVGDVCRADTIPRVGKSLYHLDKPNCLEGSSNGFVFRWIATPTERPGVARALRHNRA